MKKLDTLKKMLANTDEAVLKQMLIDIANNEAVNNDINTASKREELALLQFAELEKALKVKDKYTLVLDFNYSECRAKTIELTVCSLIDSHNKRALHLYQHTNTFDICFSCSKQTREKIDAVADIKKILKEHYDAEVRDTTVLKRVHFDEVVTACKFALFILESTLEDLQKLTEAE